MIEIGNKAPEFCLQNQDGIEICLKDVANRWIVLYFYPKDNTPGCTTEACDFSVALPDFEGLNATVLGVSPDSVKTHEKFATKKDLTITLLSDEDKAVCEKYGVWQMKKMCGKEYMGVVRTTYLLDPSGTVAYRWDNVKVKDHAKKVKEKLEELSK